MSHEEEVRLILSRARYACGKTRKKTALSLRVSESAVENWENGIYLPPLKQAKEIAETYNINAQKFEAILKTAVEEHKTIRIVRHKPPKEETLVDFPGEIESTKNILRLNDLLNFKDEHDQVLYARRPLRY